MPVSESTPLLVVRVAPHRHRYPHSKLRRTCTFILGAVLVIAVISFLLPIAILPRDHGSVWSYLPWSRPYPHRSWPHGNGLHYEQLQDILQTTPSEDKAEEWSRYYTSGPHLAGKNFSQAVWTQKKWQEFGIADTTISSYDVYINYPLDHRLALLEDEKVKFEASLEEDVLDEDPTTSLEDRVPTFHGYSASGNVTAQYVYANFGTYQDFEDLVKANVSLEGKIALIKYGRVFRGLKIKRAQDVGMIGAVLYSDPQEDGEITEENGYEAYPDGPARNPSSVQRGSAQFMSIAPGDPTTPGYPSKPGYSRENPYEKIPSIPSLPISYRDALPLLKALNGHGPEAADFNEYWQGGGLSHKGVKYNIGPSPENVVLNLYNEQEYVTTPIWNVIGTIKGSIYDEVVILGNHRDAWIAGGAGDPSSGSATFNEVIRSFGKAIEAGWQPLRTMVFASWDGEEYGLVGSTEWVEDNLSRLSAKGVAYLNVDMSTSGNSFKTSANPLLDYAIYEATGLVLSPNQTVEGQTVREIWDGSIGTMGSGSDFTAFQDFAGIPSLDMSFRGGPKDAVYPYHSNYDSFHWMSKYGDPGFQYHTAMAKLWSLVAANIVEKPVISLNATNYAIGLRKYLDSAKPDDSDDSSSSVSSHFNFKGLDHAITHFYKVAVEFDAYTASLAAQLHEDIPWWKWWKKARLLFLIRKANDKYKVLDREFLYEEGLDGRNWYKHVVFAPGLWTGYSGATFPGLVESFANGNSSNAERWGNIIESKITAAAELLG